MNVNPFKDSFTGLFVGVSVVLIPPKNTIAKKKVDWLLALSTFILAVHNGLFCYLITDCTKNTSVNTINTYNTVVAVFL